MIWTIFKLLIHVIVVKVCIKLHDKDKILQNQSFILMTVSPTVKHLYEERCHFLFKFWRDQTTLDIIEALCEILNSLKGRKNVMPDTSFHPKSVVRSQNGAKIFLKSQLINSCKNNLRVMLSFAVFTEIFLLTTIWRLDYQNEMIEV